MENYSWPDPLDEVGSSASYRPLPRELVHAVGAVVIAWTHCEEIQLHLIRELAGFSIGGIGDFRIGERIFGPMGNRQRSELLLGLIQEVKPPEPLRTLLDAFRTQFDTCLTNRNLVAHALFLAEDDTEGPLILSTKAQPNIQDRYIPSDAKFWEATISEIRALSAFGMAITDVPWSQKRGEPWPKIPPAPRNLSRILPAHIVERSRLQPSVG